MESTNIIVPSSSVDSTKRRRLHLYWNLEDERTILTELAAGLRESGMRPTRSELFRTLQAKYVLNHPNVTEEEVLQKMYNLKKKFIFTIRKGGPGNKSRDKMLYELSKEVWPEDLLKAPELI